ncbi:MAG: 4Fe-4S dicluster domain-containing protein [Candidatus Aenigmarchaeota archaeon]|nr:4Fe-4S dicluster domain-containing protein [Candidatus Aenigmarchaeota archaeon]
MGVKSEVIHRLFSKPVTTKYPAVKADLQEGLRGKVEWHKKSCIWCRMCEINCPANAIKIDKENRVWSIDSGKCIFCGRCEEVCPTKPKSVTLSKKVETGTTDRESLKDVYHGENDQDAK